MFWFLEFTFPSSLIICSDARVMWDHKTGRSKGYGFVSFRDHQVMKISTNEPSWKGKKLSFFRSHRKKKKQSFSKINWTKYTCVVKRSFNRFPFKLNGNRTVNISRSQLHFKCLTNFIYRVFAGSVGMNFFRMSSKLNLTTN